MNNQVLKFFCQNCTEQCICDFNISQKSYTKGDFIAYKGDKVKSLYFLIRGTIRTEIVSDSGLTMQIAQRKAPFPIATPFLFATKNEFPVDVIAQEDCTVVSIPRENIETNIAKCPQFLRGFLEFNANSTQYLSERMTIYAQKSLKGKIAYYILSIEKGGVFEFDRTIKSLSEYFGVGRPSLSRAIAEMVRDGIISFESGKGRILDTTTIENIIK